MHVPDLGRYLERGGEGRAQSIDWKGYLSGDLICPDGMLVRMFPVSEVVTQEDEREGDAEPHGSHRQHGGEGDGTTAVLPPDEQVDEEADPEDNPGVEGGREEGGSLGRDGW